MHEGYFRSGAWDQVRTEGREDSFDDRWRWRKALFLLEKSPVTLDLLGLILQINFGLKLAVCVFLREEKRAFARKPGHRASGLRTSV